MKNIFCLLVFIFFINCSHLIGQQANYIPVDTSNLKGKIRSCSIYEYSNATSDFSEKTGEKNVVPSAVLIFSPTKKIKEISYPNSNRKRVFFYDKSERLIFEFSGYESVSDELKFLSKNISISHPDFQKVYDNSLILEVKRYHYFDDFVMITSSKNLPPNFIYFNEYNKITKTIQYYYDNDTLRKSVTELKYTENQLKSNEVIYSTVSERKIQYEYNNLNELISQIDVINSPNGILIKTYTNDYKGSQSKYLVIKNGEIIEEIICEMHQNQEICETINDIKNTIISEVSYFDKCGNKTKEYKRVGNKYHVKEWHIEYY